VFGNGICRTGHQKNPMCRQSQQQDIHHHGLHPVGYGDLVLSGALPVDHLSEVLRTAIPADRIATLLDREGATIARSQTPGGYVGRSRARSCASISRRGAKDR